MQSQKFGEKLANSIGFVSYMGRVYVYTAVYKPCSRPCTYRVHGRLRAMYTAVTRPCTGREHGRVHVCRVHGPYVARDTIVSRVHGPYRAVTRPCTCHEHGQVHRRVQAVYIAMYTHRVHGLYMALYGRVQAVYSFVYRCIRQ